MQLPIVDTLKNLVSGLGGIKDKSAGACFALRMVDEAELNAMHRSDWLARKIVDIIPNDMTREWRDWQADEAQIEKIEAVEKAPLICTQLKVNEAMRKARLLGGALIFLGMADGTPEAELVPEQVRLGDLRYLNVLHRYEVTVGPLIYDVTSPYYREPEYYEVQGASGISVKVHPSRMIRFVGADVLDTRFGNTEVWGDSVLQVVYDAVINASSAQQHVAGLIPEAKTDVIYIPGLSEHLKNASTTKALTDRFTYAMMAKSLFNALLLEGTGGTGPSAQGERWEQKQINFAQLPELIRQYLGIAAASVDIPVTRMLNESPGGLNSTGDSDLRNYYDNISARQKVELEPKLNRLDEVTIRSALGSRDPSIYYEWAPLWGLSETDKATIFSQKATAARALAGTGGASPAILPIDALSQALTNTFVEDGSLPGLQAAIDEFGTLAEQEENQLEAQAAVTPAAPTVPAASATTDASPRPLYVRRQLLNANDVIAWARDQGFSTTLPSTDMHVTVAYSKTPLDWMKIPDAWSFGDGKGGLVVAAGGPRLVERLGMNATVLLFGSSELAWRHMAIREAGASWDYDEYQPHITITYDAPDDLDLATVEPYRGELRFGPEIFETLNEDWKSSVSEA